MEKGNLAPFADFFSFFLIKGFIPALSVLLKP